MLAALKFDITAQDRFAASFGKLKGELGGVKGALAGVSDYARRTGRSMRNIGSGFSLAVSAPLMMLGRQSLQLYDTQVKAENAVAQAITSTGGAARRTLPQLKGLASAMQSVTTFGDEDILRNVTAPLLTFTKVQGDVFDRAQANVLDMATMLKMDLKSAAIMVGKAMNDPIKGLNSLGRSGIQFEDSQKKVIKSMVKTGNVAGAQALILKELEKQFGDQAAKALDSPLGKLDNLSNAIGDVKEELGKEIATFLPAIREDLEAGVKWFSELDASVKKNIVVFGGLAAAFGPALTGLGLITLAVPAVITSLSGVAKGMVAIIRFAPAMGAAMYTALGPWGILAGLAVAAGAALITFGQNAKGTEQPQYDAAAATAALNGELAVFYGSAAPSSAASAIALANDNYKLADSALAAARAELAKRRAMNEQAEQRLADNNAAMPFGTALGKNLEAEATDNLAAAERALEAAERARNRSVRAVTGSMSELMSGTRTLNSEIGVTLNGLDGLGKSAGGAAPKVKGLTDEMKAAEERAQKLGQAAMSVDQQWGSSFSSIIRGAENMGDALSRVLDNLADQILSNTFTSMFSSIGLGDLFAPLVASADGNVFSGGRMVPFASGGVVDSPTMFPMRGGTGLMGEAGPEAIMPLTRGSDGKLGVRAQGGGGGDQVQVTFAPVIDARGADQAAVARLEAVVAQQAESFGARVQQELRRGNNRRVNRAWAGA